MQQLQNPELLLAAVSCPKQAIRRPKAVYRIQFSRIWPDYDEILPRGLQCVLPTKLEERFSWPEHVSGAERQNFPLIAQLYLRESRSPLRSRSDDLPLPFHSSCTSCF